MISEDYRKGSKEKRAATWQQWMRYFQHLAILDHELSPPSAH